MTRCRRRTFVGTLHLTKTGVACLRRKYSDAKDAVRRPRCPSRYLDCRAGARGRATLLVRLQGHMQSETALRVTAEFGSPVGHWARIYSEPSHTLLLAIVDKAWADSGIGSPWLEQTRAANPSALVQTGMPFSLATVRVPPRPVSDDRLAVWVEGPEGGDGILISNANIGTGKQSFGFSTRLSSDSSLSRPLPTMMHCCEGANCGQMCVTCKDSSFTCCLLPSCCDIFCGSAGACCG